MSRVNTASQGARLPASNANPLFLAVAGLLFLWLLSWVWRSWPYSLDDALIHLRYADHLLHQGRITYDGVHTSFGTSSLLYVGLLAALRAVWISPMLPRTISSLVHVVFYLLLVAVLWRHQQRSAGPRWLQILLAVGLLASVVAPSAVRWMDDGMETSLVFLDALLGVLLVRRLREAVLGRSTALRMAAFCYGLLTVLLRVELLSLVVCVAGMAWLATLPGQREAVAPRPLQREQRIAAALPVAGALCGMVFVLATMHALLPDTALAKAFGPGAWRDTLSMAKVTIASSFSFGVGMLLLWLVSALALLLLAQVRLEDLLPNLLFPFLLGAAASRGQAIQGIRYFGWTLFFPLLWNLLRLGEHMPRGGPARAKGLALFTCLLVLCFVPAFVWESATFARLFAGRSAALERFRAQPELARLQGLQGTAEDVGFVGYFTQGDLCDPYGLINGRAAARLKYPQRFQHCMALHPVFVFGSTEFLHKVEPNQDLAPWLVCGTYNFENVRSHDVHYLLVAPQERAACPGATPLSTAFPGLL